MRIRAGLCVLIASALLASGCSGDEGTIEAHPSDGASGNGAPEVPDAQPFDPPSAFDVAAGTALPGEAWQNKISIGGNNIKPLPVALHGTTAYIVSVDRFQVVDTRTAEPPATVSPQLGTPRDPAGGVFVGDNPAEAPVIAEVGGATLVVAPFTVTETTTGTEEADRFVELIALDAGTRQIAFSVPVELPEGADDGYEEIDPRVLGVSGGIAVLSINAARLVTVAVDLTTRTVAWSKVFQAQTIAGDLVIGQTVVGSEGLKEGQAALSIADGSATWQGKSFGLGSLYPAGPNFAVSISSTGALDDGTFRLIEAATGEVKETVEDGSWTLVECMFDGQETVVCYQRGPDWVGAYDATSGEMLWQLPDKSSDRTSPMLTTAWHGAVYGSSANGPVVLDARTGEDRSTTPGVAPLVVNEYVGIATVPDGDGDVLAYPATG